ncbi:ABC transporter permease [Mucilaginibacter sp. OK283]|uniref:ABC transporter permease n=1 Tax=Mucilaginibacter sp. OK283 TaxID=1881049 RepID=UPI0008C17D02|nr:ABC transporter permease [Mucilaginibacter sp. OK283]SEO67356.1 putative ABC transport system permease protein [Mucilaginibacter sp. OK283]
MILLLYKFNFIVAMLKNYFKTAWRNLFRNKFYSLINIAGLTAGLAIGILILLWVQDELSFDSFHKNAENIYRVELFGGTGASKQIWQTTVAPIGPLAKQELTDVQDQVRLIPNWFYSLYKYKEKVFGEQNVGFADPSLFSIFDFPLIEGNTTKPFLNDNSVIITKKTAQKYFGNESALGKVIVAEGKENFTVSGVINDFPLNSSINYDMIMPMSYHIKYILEHGKQDANTDFNNYSYQTYFKLKPGTSLKKLSADLFRIHIKHRAEDTDADYLLLPINKMHLYNADLTDHGIQTVRIFIIIALVILLIACINYVNLSTARALLRAKEISMRKIIGAGKIQLFMQFLAETGLLFLIATVFALFTIYLLMPVFNQLAGKQLVFNLFDPHIWLIISITVVATLALSSIYPAMLLSSFEPLKALKGKISGSIGDALFRKILVVVQFTFSVVLIVSTLVITRQLKYIQSKNLGYDKSHVFGVWMRDASKHYDAVRAELLKQPGVEDVTRATGNIINSGGNISGDNSWDGKAPGQTFILHPMGIDKDFISFFKLKMQQGNTFSGAVADSTHFILNEAAVKEIGLKDPIGRRFRFQKTNGTIIGVVKDFHFASMREKIAPAIFFYRPAVYQTLYIKTNTKNAAAAIAAAGDQFKQYNGEFPFSYNFLDDIFNDLYQGEQREGTLFNYFAGMAILISCLGLLGLAAYTAQVRTREIGVRKVLGASVTGVIGLLAKDFIKLVLIAIVIAFPLAWYAMSNWLNGFAYRIPIHWTVFVLAAFIAIVVAFVTISFQSIKAALANPVKTLRSE